MALALTEYRVHPAAELFPLLLDEDLARLAEDIHERGLREPIITHQGMILDGRNRLAACELAGVPPRFTEWTGDLSPTVFILSKNKHLYSKMNVPQRAAVAVEAMTILKDETEQRTTLGLPVFKTALIEITGRELQVCVRVVKQAMAVLRLSPEEFQRVKRGETPVRTAYRNAKGVPVKPTREQRVESIRSLAAEGMNDADIADALHLGVQRVRTLAREENIAVQHKPVEVWATRHLRVNNVIEATAMNARANVSSLEMVDHLMHRIDVSKIPEWLESLKVGRNGLDNLIRKLQRRVNK